jgi:hypothetical protein
VRETAAASDHPCLQHQRDRIALEWNGLVMRVATVDVMASPCSMIFSDEEEDEEEQ